MFDYLKGILIYSEDSPMLFSKLNFWIFFAILLIGYSFIYRKKALRNVYLFAFSLYFYYRSGGYFFSLLIFSIIIDYSMGLLINSSEKKTYRVFYMIVSIIVNIGLLAYFKYSYFFTDIFNSIFNTNLKVENLFAKWSNDLVGSHFDISKIILPVGISFYTFQSLSYTIDVYRKKIKPLKNIIDYGFFVTFFPQLVAGPIVRAADFLPQLYNDYKLTKTEFNYAVFLILNGLIKKMVISDYISINFVDRIFDNPLSFTGFENLMAIYGYSIQIYCDFSGYTDIAIGTALLLGYRLLLNFNSPYKAENITDFWRRWHISLSSWLRDYLYISLGGNRKGKIRTYINLMLTMLLGGLWHGASLKFVIWGGIHGAALAIHKIWMKLFNFKKESSIFVHFISVFFTFHIVAFAWIFFRADNMNAVNNMLSQIFNNFNFALIPEMIISYKIIFILITVAFIIHWLPIKIKDFYKETFIKTPVYLKIIISIVIVILLYQAKSSELQPFIYFQF